MICISVTPTSRTLAKVDLLNASRQGDVVELCIDHLAKTPDFKDLIGDFDKPVIISCRRKEEGGHWNGTEEERLSLLRQAIVAGPDYIELDLDIAPQIPRFGETKRVISFTRLDRPEYDIDSIFDEAVEHQADVIKFRWPTPTLTDAWPLLAAVSQRRSIPIVGQGLSRGELTFSILSKKYHSPWIYAALEKGMEDFPGQATIHDLNEIYHLNDIDKNTNLVAVAGLAEAGTQTVKTINEGFKKLGIDKRCLPMHIEKLDRLLKMFDILKIKVLIANPSLASELVSLTDHIDEKDKKTNYCDLFLKRADGWYGYNTLLRSLHKKRQEILEQGNSHRRGTALVIGTGETTRTAIEFLKNENVLVTLAAPDEKKAQALAEELEVRCIPSQAIYDTHNELVFLTDANLKAGSSRDQINPSCFRPEMMIVDLTDLPVEHPLFSEAKTRDCYTLSPSALWEAQMNACFKTVTGESLVH